VEQPLVRRRPGRFPGVGVDESEPPVRNNAKGTLMLPALPKPIADYVEANAQLDVDGMLKPFASDALFLDNGRRYEGQAELRALFE